MGAAILAARACLRSGVGLLTVHVPRCGVNIMQTAVPEAMVEADTAEEYISSVPDNLERYSALAVGPGLGYGDCTQRAVVETLVRWSANHGNKKFTTDYEPPQNINLVIDADGLNILAMHPECMPIIGGAVLTPHQGEYKRLFGKENAQEISDKYGIVIVNKAHRTLVHAPFVPPYENRTGNAGMATAGSGDVLTGIVLALLAQNDAYGKRHTEETGSLQDIVSLAVYMHGEAGNRVAQRHSQYSVIASDIIENLYCCKNIRLGEDNSETAEQQHI